MLLPFCSWFIKILKRALKYSKANENNVKALEINQLNSNLKHKEPQRIRKMREYYVAQDGGEKSIKLQWEKCLFCVHTQKYEQRLYQYSHATPQHNPNMRSPSDNISIYMSRSLTISSRSMQINFNDKSFFFSVS